MTETTNQAITFTFALSGRRRQANRPFRLDRLVVIALLGTLGISKPTDAADSSAGTQTAPARDHTIRVQVWTQDLPEGVTTPQQQAEMIADKAARLEAATQTAKTPLDRFDALLAVANWSMAHEIDGAASKYVLGVAKPADLAEAVAVVQLAQQRLDQADHLWSEVESADDQPSGTRRRRRQTLESLQAFAKTFLALWNVDDRDADAQDKAQAEAAGELSFVLEDERPEVAAAAKLWQAVIYGQRGTPSRALDLLPPVVSSPGDTGRYGFYLRLLRCRYTAEAGEGYAAAIALAARTEERCLHWFESPAVGRVAQRNAALIRKQITQQWAEELRTTGHGDRAAWCDQSVAEIVGDYFDTDSPADVLGLGQTIPELVDIDRVLEPPADDAQDHADAETADDGGPAAANSNGAHE